MPVTSINQHVDIQEIWSSREKKEQIAQGFVEWIDEIEWKYFITLTFAASEITEEAAKNRLNYVIQLLNKQVFGKHYTKKVKHSYFSYVCALEKQLRGTYHFHILVDRSIDFDYLNSLWHGWSGICDFGPVIDLVNAEKYICKYAIDGNITYYKSKNSLPSISVF